MKKILEPVFDAKGNAYLVAMDDNNTVFIASNTDYIIENTDWISIHQEVLNYYDAIRLAKEHIKYLS